MLPTVSSAQIKAIDSSSQEFGVSVEQLMENAGKRVSERAGKMLRKPEGKTITIYAGSGNKGGDGLVAARLLAEKKANVHVVLSSLPSQLKELPLRQLKKLDGNKNVFVHSVENDGRLSEECRIIYCSSLIIDALLGFGLESNPRGAKAELINLANYQHQECNVPILSIDVPSGLDSDTGKPFSPCIKATATITLGLVKTGLLAGEAKHFTGKLFLADIGIPEKALEKNGVKNVKFGEQKIICL